MSDGPLAGRRVLVTRPKGRAGVLEALIREAGGEPILWPAIEIADPEDFARFDELVERLGQFDLAIFISPTAAEKALERIEQRGIGWPEGLPVAAIGPGTRRELVRSGFADVLAPEHRADSEALLELPALTGVRGKRVAIFRGAGGRELLATVLAERGATVEYAECYRRMRPQGPAAPPAWAAQPVDAATVSSSEGLAHVAEMLGRWRRNWTEESVLFVPHRRVGEEASRLGVREVVLAGATDEEIASRLVAYFRDAK